MAEPGRHRLPRVVTAGETMVLVVPPTPGRLRHAGAVQLSIGGAESNVAIGLSRLGDAFAAGYLAATLQGLGPADRLRTANAMGAFCVQSLGDYEGLPSRRELTAFLDHTVDLGR